MSEFLNKSQQRGFRVLKALKGKEMNGVSNKELVDGLGLSEVQVTRDLQNLEYAGLVERMENGKWRFAPFIPSAGVEMLRAADQAKEQADQVVQRYTRIR